MAGFDWVIRAAQARPAIGSDHTDSAGSLFIQQADLLQEAAEIVLGFLLGRSWPKEQVRQPAIAHIPIRD
nr:hypothetical protein GCM10011355_08660 [Aquisalinus luteolus]